ncbi:MAG: hypothetical protein ABWY27_02185 [Telluria sp.]
MLAAASGVTLMFHMNGMHDIVAMDEAGNTANISIYDVYQSNGVIKAEVVVLPEAAPAKFRHSPETHRRFTFIP